MIDKIAAASRMFGVQNRHSSHDQQRWWYEEWELNTVTDQFRRIDFGIMYPSDLRTLCWEPREFIRCEYASGTHQRIRFMFRDGCQGGTRDDSWQHNGTARSYMPDQIRQTLYYWVNWTEPVKDACLCVAFV